jgi:chemosensory pili system protein ChpA (sensor histidine kinase/response regulator)
VLRAGPDAAGSLTRVELDETLQLPRQHAARQNRPCIVLDCGAEHIALSVDRILDIREILVKPPTGILRRSTAVSGTTTLADGSVVLVLRPPQLLREHRRRSADTAGANQQIPAIRQTTGPLEILVIDDSVSVRRVVANTLRKYGWNVTAARDGLDGLETLHSMDRYPDAILVDVEMPRMDGYDFTASIRSDPATQGIPVIMLTSRGGDKHREKAFDAGVNDFLVKPYAEESLVATLRRHTQAF